MQRENVREIFVSKRAEEECRGISGVWKTGDKVVGLAKVRKNKSNGGGQAIIRNIDDANGFRWKQSHAYSLIRIFIVTNLALKNWLDIMGTQSKGLSGRCINCVHLLMYGCETGDPKKKAHLYSI